MYKQVQDKCGVAVTPTLHTTHNYMKSLEHRGKEASGIAAVAEDGIDAIKWPGPPGTVDLEDLVNIFRPHNYYGFLGHTRYKTRGSDNRLLEDAHPHTIGGETLHRGNHILIRNADLAIVHNGEVPVQEEISDTKALLQYYSQSENAADVLRDIPLAYTLAIADAKTNHIVAMRDRTGIRPGVLGKKDGQYTIASEDIAIRKNGGRKIEDMNPGAIYKIRPRGEYEKRQVVEPNLNRCFFEFNYLADQDSILDGHSVEHVRRKHGEILADRLDFENTDYVIPVPRTPEPAARAYAESTGTTFLNAFYKLDAERSFMGTTQQERRETIQRKLHNNPRLAEKMKDSVVTAIDDSIVRGTVARHVSMLLDEAGVAHKRLLSYTPKIGIRKEGEPRGCKWGVSMHPEETDFIARDSNAEEIADTVGMPVYYETIDDTAMVFEESGLPISDCCTYCIGGQSPGPNS